jgi:hypothetical protein
MYTTLVAHRAKGGVEKADVEGDLQVLAAPRTALLLPRLEAARPEHLLERAKNVLRRAARKSKDVRRVC